MQKWYNIIIINWVLFSYMVIILIDGKGRETTSATPGNHISELQLYN